MNGLSAFKYFSISNCIRFLDGLSLRLTPSEEFNDPFELHPPVDGFFNNESILAEAKLDSPERLIDETATLLEKQFGYLITKEECKELVHLARRKTNHNQLADRLRKFKTKAPELTIDRFLKLRVQLKKVFEAIDRKIDEIGPGIITDANTKTRQAIQKELSEKLGVVCLTKNGAEPLMWAHYADSHKGAMIEFSTSHQTFQRRENPNSLIGEFQSVNYVEERPNINLSTLKSGHLFEYFALTKSHHWKYEEEIRLILQLKDADQINRNNGADIYLINTPTSAIHSITFGCKSKDEDIAIIRLLLRNIADTGHIILRKASLHETRFDLIYKNLN